MNERRIRLNDIEARANLKVTVIADPIRPDNDEIDDAQWFEVDNLPNTPPPGVSISGDLIQHYLNSLK